MAMLTEYSDIRISRLSVPPIIPAVQGDTGRQLVFTPTDYTIPDDCTATYYIQKPSGNAVYNNATIEDGKVVCDLTAQALAENGDNYGQIRIMKDEEVVTSFDFVLLVKPFRGIDAIESTTEMNIFDKAVEQAEEAIEAAAQEAEEYISQAIDDTLTIEGKAADAKATGDAITNVASDLSDLSDTVSGQGDRLDTAENDIDGLQGDMTTAQEDIGTLQGDVSNLDETKASVDGTYPNLTAGTAEQLLSDTYVEDSTPYLRRRSKSGSREYDELVGGSIVYNQLVDSGTSSVTVPSGHKYYAVIGGTASIGTGGSALSVTGGTDMVVDLSVMFGSAVADHIYNLEQSTVGAGVALFNEMFGSDYLLYNSGELMSVSGVSAHVMRDADDNIIGNYPLDSSLTLRGVPKVADGKICYGGDIYSADGNVKRKTVQVTLNGTELWGNNGSGNSTYFSLIIGNLNSVVTGSIISDKYVTTTITSTNTDVGIGLANSSVRNRAILTLRPASVNGMTVDQFKALLASNPVTCIYELSAVDTTESATPYQHLQVVDAGGTEEYVTTGLVPVGHNTKYPTDIVKKIDGLPSDFSTLIAPTETQMVATRNYNTGALFIVANVLYKATANIANGGAITPGTNCLATTLAEVISALS